MHLHRPGQASVDHGTTACFHLVITIICNYFSSRVVANTVEMLCNLIETYQGHPGMETTVSQAVLDIQGYSQSMEVAEVMTSNRFYDDLLWHALAWLRAHDVTSSVAWRHRYLALARACYARAVTESWDEGQCQGGCWWSMDKDYKNAITNALFTVSSFRLYMSTTQEEWYLRWAERSFQWFLQSDMWDPSTGLINDGLVTATCLNNHQPTWTYNQGVILSAFADAHQLKMAGKWKLPVPLSNAFRLIDAVMQRLTSATSQVLIEPCDYNELGQPTDCGPDGKQFKGIFMRHLMYFVDRVGPDGMPTALFQRIQAFVQANAQSILAHAVLPESMSGRDACYGQHWMGGWIGLERCNAISQTSALDALLAHAHF